MKILLVDDQFNAHDGMPLITSPPFNLAEFLEAEGYALTFGRNWRTSANSPEALAVVPRPNESAAELIADVFCGSSFDADVVVLDQHFPQHDISGIELLRFIRARDHEVPVLLLTAFEDIAADANLSFDAGRAQASQFIPKRQLAARPRLLLELGKPDESYSIDRRQQRLANDLCFTGDEEYDLMECARLGSLAFFLQEDDALLNSLEACCGDRLNRHEPVHIVDYGCGTGRFEELLLDHYPTVKITAFDFASGMVRAAGQKPKLRSAIQEGRLTLDKGNAEYYRLAEGERADFAILGFGFLSYCDASRTLQNLRESVLRTDGTVFATFYNADSPYYEIWREQLEQLHRLSTGIGAPGQAPGELRQTLLSVQRALPISTTIFPQRSRLAVFGEEGPTWLTCRPMALPEFERLVAAAGFEFFDKPNHHIGLLGELSEAQLEHLLLNRPGNPVSTLKGNPERYFHYFRKSREEEGEAPATLDPTLIEVDRKTGQRSSVPGYYTSVTIRPEAAV